MENANSKKKLIISLIVLVLAGLAVFYFYKNYKRRPFTSPPPTSTGQVHNPAERLPDTNPYDAETNPFEAAKTNPFKDIYKNPFSK